MVDRHPLIVNPTASQIQELPSGDYLYGTIPVGGIIMWSGTIASIPSNWSLCNGSNGTPDLRNTFVIGAHSDSSGAKTTVTGSATASGGSKDATLVSHEHTTDSIIETGSTSAKDLSGSVTHISEGFNVNGTVSGVFTKTNQGNSSPTGSASTSPVSGISMDVNHRHSTDTQGSAATDKNLPPYVALAYIIRTS